VYGVTATAWTDAKAIIGETRVTLGPQASDQWLNAPDHLSFVLARYRAAAALIGNSPTVLEVGCGEGIGARILKRSRRWYTGLDTDEAAISVAADQQTDANVIFLVESALEWNPDRARYDAIVSLDVIEHIPAESEGAFLGNIASTLTEHGVCVIGTPNAAFEHLASPQSKAGHINPYTHDRLYELMTKHFHVVQSFGMQDTSLHLGHPDVRHYLLMCGIGPRGAV